MDRIARYRLSTLLTRLWDLRRSPRRVVRVVWWASLAGLIGLILAPKAVGWLLFGLWLTANVGLIVFAVGWGLIHPRTVLSARDVILRWAFCLTLLITLTLSSSLETVGVITSATGIVPVSSSSLLLLLALILCPVLLVLLLALGAVGTAIGAFMGRRWTSPRHAARIGAGAWWLVSLFVTLITVRLSLFRPGGSGELHGIGLAWNVGLIAGVPWFTAWTGRLIQRLAYDPQQVARRWLQQIARRLVRRTRRGRLIDLRGAALGLAAGLLALVAVENLLIPLRAGALVTMIQIRNAALWTAQDINLPVDRQRERMVLLEMDDAARHAALTARSEAAVQAEMIRKLSAWKPQLIVLPLPLLNSTEINSPLPVGTHIEPTPTRNDVNRTYRDLPELEAAMRAAGNVLLAVPREYTAVVRPGQGELGYLRAAAQGVGESDLAPYTARLPAIPTQDRPFPPIPILIYAAARHRLPTIAPVPHHPNQVEIAGTRIPQIVSGTILVDFRGTEPRQDFAHVAYGSILRGESLYAPPPDNAPIALGRWQPPSAYFKDKIIFLDALERRTIETPIGPIPRMEALAHATAALLALAIIERPNPLITLLISLFVGVLIGQICILRDPLDAGWRIVIPTFLVFAFAMAAFFNGTWVDPVAPITAALIAYLLVTQFTFALERNQRDRLKRFLAAEIVDELLADADEELELGGERRQVCVLFADARGFTPFAEQHTPDEVVYVINKYMAALTEVLSGHRGILDKYTGDGLMAIFRVTDTPRSDVERAVCAALAMREAAHAVSLDLMADGKEPLPIGIGVHYGEAVVGLVGSEETQVNYTALGYTVVVGHRLQSIAAGGEVIISEAVYSQTSGAFRVEERAPVYVKGLSVPVRPYCVVEALS